MIQLATVKTAILVVAHPDDETLWAGGLLVRTAPKIAWTVFCCSIPRRDPVRAFCCKRACAVLGVACEQLVQIESSPSEPLPYLHDALSRWNWSRFDVIVTHGPEGEYGHVHHRQLSQWCTTHVPERTATLGYGAGRGATVLTLTRDEQAKKLEALQCYDQHLPYDGQMMPKWEALRMRYGRQFDFATERYDGLTL